MLTQSGIKIQKTTPHSASPVANFMVMMLITWGIVCAICIVFASTAKAQEIASGTSSRQLRKDVVRSLPYAQLNAETKAKIGDILEKPSLYRRLPTTAISIDSEFFQFLIRYPETVVGIWELMDITHMKTQRVGPYSLKTDDGAGTTSDMELVFGSPDLHIYYGDGLYEGPVLRKKLRGECVIIIRTRPHTEINTGEIIGQRPDDPLKTACQLDVFLKLESNAAGMIAKTISPIVGPTADHNFTESLKFVERLHETTVGNGPGVQKMAERLDIDQHVIEKFQAVAGRAYDRAAQRAAKANTNYDFSRNDRPSDLNSSQPSPVKAQPFPATATPASTAYPYQQQTYQYPTRGRSNVRSYNAFPAGGNFYDSGSVRRAAFSDQYSRDQYPSDPYGR